MEAKVTKRAMIKIQIRVAAEVAAGARRVDAVLVERAVAGPGAAAGADGAVRNRLAATLATRPSNPHRTLFCRADRVSRLLRVSPSVASVAGHPHSEIKICRISSAVSTLSED